MAEKVIGRIFKIIFRLGAAIAIVSCSYGIGLVQKVLGFSEVPVNYSFLGISIGCLMLVPGFLIDAKEWKGQSAQPNFRLTAYGFMSLLMGCLCLLFFFM